MCQFVLLFSQTNVNIFMQCVLPHLCNKVFRDGLLAPVTQLMWKYDIYTVQPVVEASNMLTCVDNSVINK